MISLKTDRPISRSIEAPSNPRISFPGSADLFNNNNFISTTPNPKTQKELETEKLDKGSNVEFEFLFNNSTTTDTMLTADELFFEGKLLPSWKIQHLEKLTLKPKHDEVEEDKKENKQVSRVSWLADEDPSPRPPKCTVLWKELLRLKKQHSSSSSSSSPSSSSSSSSMDDVKEGKEGMWSREKHLRRIKKGLERTRSASIIIRPLINVPICTRGKTNGVLPPLFSLKKGNVER